MMEYKHLVRRMVEIDFNHKHGHLSGCLSALPIILSIYKTMDLSKDTFILSKGHASAAWYVVLEQYGYHPDVSKVHPDIDIQNGISCHSGSLGHGLPIAVGMALAHKIKGTSGNIHVLLGDGECLEGTNWESLNIANRYRLHGRLFVYVDDNGWQGSEQCLDHYIPQLMNYIYPVFTFGIPKGQGVDLYQQHPEWHVHAMTKCEYDSIMKELS